MTPDAPTDRYWDALLGVAPRMLGLLDRESRSPTRGSFDRVHWAWKFRDFPLNMWQASMMPLALLHRTRHPGNPYTSSERLSEWLAFAMEATLQRQHRNGAFDTVAPFSQDHGVTLAMVLSIATTVEALEDALPPGLRDRALEALARGCRFASRSDEDYAFISNHQGAFALAWTRAGRLLGDAQLPRRAEQVAAEILRRQSPDGWFEEYGGPDPGYETLGLTYLALLAEEQPIAGLADALRRCVDFLSHCIHPDGSIGGNYGSRHTGQFAPGGLELLAPTLPMAGAICDFMSARAALGNLVTPQRSDDDNLPLLTYSYAVAARAGGRRSSPRPLLPCEQSGVWRRFDDSGIVVAGTQRYFAVTNLAKGGVVRVFDRRKGCIAYEDSGFVLGAGKALYASHLLGESRPEKAGEAAGEVRTVAQFAAVRNETLTPLKFLILRLLSLTVFRSPRLGALVRRMIIARLITGRHRGPWELIRTLTFSEGGVSIDDAVTPRAGVPVTFASLERSLVPIHMGSARYFHANELVALAPLGLSGWCESLSSGRAARRRAVIPFVDDVRVSESHPVPEPHSSLIERRPV